GSGPHRVFVAVVIQNETAVNSAEEIQNRLLEERDGGRLESSFQPRNSLHISIFNTTARTNQITGLQGVLDAAAERLQQKDISIYGVKLFPSNRTLYGDPDGP